MNVKIRPITRYTSIYRECAIKQAWIQRPEDWSRHGANTPAIRPNRPLNRVCAILSGAKGLSNWLLKDNVFMTCGVGDWPCSTLTSPYEGGMSVKKTNWGTTRWPILQHATFCLETISGPLAMLICTGMIN